MRKEGEGGTKNIHGPAATVQGRKSKVEVESSMTFVGGKYENRWGK